MRHENDDHRQQNDDATARVERVTEWLRERIADITERPLSAIDPRKTPFEFGFDSVQAIQLQGEIEDFLDEAMPMAWLYESIPLGQLAERIASSKPCDAPATMRAEAHAHPLSLGQRALWFFHQMAPESSAHNLARRVRVRGEFHPSLLAEAFLEVTKRHAALHSTVDARGAEPRFAPGPAQIAFEHVTVRDRSEDEIDAIATEHANAPFALQRGPLVRLRVLERAADDHEVLLVVHHIAVDLWSFLQVVDEAFAAYARQRNERTGEEHDAPAPPVHRAHYADFVAEQMAEPADGYPGLAAWAARFESPLPVLELPADRAAPAAPFGPNGTHTVRLAPELVQRLRTLGEEHGTSLFVVLLAGIGAALHRWCGQDDIVIGTAVANRTRTAYREVVGHFLNSLPVRIEVASERGFREQLTQTMREVGHAMAQQHVPFAKLISAVQPARISGRHPIFQTMFLMQSVPSGMRHELAPFVTGEAGARIRLGGLDLESRENPPGASEFDLVFVAAEASDGVALALQYRRDRFEPETIVRMADELARLLDAASSDPACPIRRLPLLSAESLARQVLEWNRTEAPYGDACLHQLFERQARLTPNAVAVIDGARRMTFDAINRRANRLAHCLRARGVGPEMPVGICMARSLETTVAVLGVLKAGGVYLPLDPSYPPARLRFMLEDSRAPAVVTSGDVSAALGTASSGAARIFALDADAALLEASPDTNPEGDASPDRAAYIIYTSGSSGVPKGVIGLHRGAVNRFQWMWAHYPFEPGERGCQKTALGFLDSLWEILGPLLQGVPSVVIPNGDERDPERLLETLESQEITRLVLVPSLLRALLEQPGDLARRLRALRFCVTSGEALPADLAQRFHARLPAVELLNLYGASEVSADVTFDAVRPGGDVAIGRPIANTRILLLDRHGSPVPLGATGEIHVGGMSLARGYVHRPDLTAERFVPDATGAFPGERLYRTGDLGRYLGDGRIVYLGRCDQQWKIRGIRIEPNEIESALKAIDTIADALVLVRGERLVGYVIPKSGCTVAPDEVRKKLRQTLPDVMVPAAVVVLDAWPLTPSRKIDRLRLPEPRDEGAGASQQGPRTEAERILVAIWHSLLNKDRIGVDDSFFDLGGHSLLATQLTLRIRDAFGLDLPIRALFESPTVALLAETIERARGEQPPLVALPPIEPLPARDGRLALSFAQERLWFLEQLRPGLAVHNVPLLVRIRGAIDVAALTNALHALVRRHETLRTVFGEEDGAPFQRVVPHAELPLTRIDLRTLPADEREPRLEDHVRTEAARGFDLRHAPLLRAQLLHLATHEHALFLVVHHIAVDGWSLGVLIRELREYYEAGPDASTAAHPVLPESRLHYADYAQWQRRYASDRALQPSVDYWKQKLDAMPAPLALPTDRPRPQTPRHRGGRIDWVFERVSSESLTRLGRERHATLFMVLLTAYAALLARLAGERDFVVTSPIANRAHRDAEGIVGFFVNLLPLRIDAGGAPSFAELLERIRGLTLDAYAHQHVPFEQIVDGQRSDAMRDGGAPSRAHLALNNAALPPLVLGDALCTATQCSNGTAMFELSLVVTDIGGALSGAFEYDADLFDDATIHRWRGYLETLLEAMLREPSQRVEAVSLPGPSELALLRAWNDTAQPRTEGTRAVHHLFARHARERPDAAAVVCGSTHLGYAALERRANQLAHHLLAHDVRTDTVVAICLERSAFAIVALLAVLKAGGACLAVPLGGPDERVAAILADPSIGLVISDRATSDDLPAIPHARWLFVDDVAWSDLPRTAPEVPFDEEQLAYIVRTSGSSGEPKSVAITHRSLSNNVFVTANALGIDPHHRVGQYVALGFDVAMADVFTTLCSGATLEIAPAGLLGGADLARWLRATQTSHVQLPAPVLTSLPSMALPSLETLVVGGEPCPPEVTVQWAAGRRLINAYGPSEATVATHMARYAGAVPLPLGSPLANVTGHVLDLHGNLAPIGVAGELHVGGVALARGYLRRPDLTAERFVPDPFSDTPGARLYKTGDCVRRRADGDLEFVGRLDRQLKVVGLRIEPAEIEACLCEHPSVRSAAVVAVGDGEVSKLVGYVTPGAAVPPPMELIAHLRKRLPRPMVPSTIVVIDAMPLTPHGKIDFEQLGMRELSASTAEASTFVPPRTHYEVVVADIWREVLEVARVGIHDDFFALGGNSLSGVRAVSRISESLGITVPVRTLFDAPTVAGFVQEALLLAAKSEEHDDLDALIENLEDLSDDDVEELLRAQEHGS